MEVGQIVYSIKGRDAGEYYIIVEVDNIFVYICDGKRRKLEKPKKKNIAHVKIVGEIDNQEKKLLNSKKLLDSYIQKVLKKFLSRESISDRKEV